MQCLQSGLVAEGPARLSQKQKSRGVPDPMGIRVFLVEAAGRERSQATKIGQFKRFEKRKGQGRVLLGPSQAVTVF